MAEEKTTIEEIMEAKDILPEIEEVETPAFSGEEITPSPGGKEAVGSPALEVDAGGEPVIAPKNPIDKRFGELETANNGLLEELKKERNKRQNLEGRFSQVNEFLVTAQQQRQQETAQQQAAAQPTVPEDLMVEFRQDGDGETETPIIKASAIREIIRKELTPLQQDLMSTRNQQVQQTQFDGLQKIQNSIVSENAAYRGGMQKLSGEWAWISQNFDNLVNSTGRGPRSQREAEEMLYSSGIEAEFAKRYPASDFETVVEAFMATGSTITRKLRKALGMASAAKGTPGKSLDQAKLLGRKTSFASVPNSKKPGMKLESIADLPLESLLSLTETQAEKLYDLMEEE